MWQVTKFFNSLLAELLKPLVPALEIFWEEAKALGLEVNWQKHWFKHWALSRTSLQVFASVGTMSNVWNHLSTYECLQRILDIRWHDLVRNADIRRNTNQPPLSAIIKSHHLTFIGHLARMDENADASQVVFEPQNLSGHAQLGQRTFVVTCLRWILEYMRLEIWCKIGLSGDWYLCTALCTTFKILVPL